MGKQLVTVRLDAELLRSARVLVGPNEPYEALSELIEVALENHLVAEETLGGYEAPREDGDAFLRRPEHDVMPLTTQQAVERAPLFALTNRLLPIKIAARVLANLAPDDPSVTQFQATAARAARTVGLRVRREDEAAGRKGSARRWIALPVGADEDAALSRYVSHFTLFTRPDGSTSGPMVELGLADVDQDGHPRLTERGAELAAASNPVLDDTDQSGDVLSAQERLVFIAALRENAAELAAIHEAVAFVRDLAGRQADVDAALGAAHSSWSAAQCVSHRAALVGRLHDLGLAYVEGRGPDARIRTAPDIAEHFESR